MSLLDRLFAKKRALSSSIGKDTEEHVSPSATSSRDLTEVQKLLTEIRLLHSHADLTPATSSLIRLGALPRLAELLRSSELHSNVRESLVGALLRIGISGSDPDLILLALEHPKEEHREYDLALESRGAASVLSGCSEDRLIEFLRAATSYWPVDIACLALRERGTEKALEALAHVPDLRFFLGDTKSCAIAAAESIIPHLSDDALSSIAAIDGPWKALGAEERERRKDRQQANDKVAGLLERLTNEDARVRAMNEIGVMGAAAWAGDARHKVVSALQAILRRRENSFEHRKAAYDALRAIGEKVTAMSL